MGQVFFPVLFDLFPHKDLIYIPLICQIDKPEEVGFSVRPLILAVDEYHMMDFYVCPFFKLPYLPTYKMTFINRITHFATSLGLSPIFFNLPYNFWIIESGNRTIQISSRNVKPILIVTTGDNEQVVNAIRFLAFMSFFLPAPLSVGIGVLCKYKKPRPGNYASKLLDHMMIGFCMCSRYNFNQDNRSIWTFLGHL